MFLYSREIFHVIEPLGHVGINIFGVKNKVSAIPIHGIIVILKNEHKKILSTNYPQKRMAEGRGRDSAIHKKF